MTAGLLSRYHIRLDGNTVAISFQSQRSTSKNDSERALLTLIEVSNQKTWQLSKLQYVKSGLMNDLLTGRVRVPEGIAVTG